MWALSYPGGALQALDPVSGAVQQTIQVGAVPTFASPSAADGSSPCRAPHNGVKAFDGPAGPPPPAPPPPAVSCPRAPAGSYQLAAADGGVFTFGTAFCGSAGAIALSRPIVSAALDPTGGYWLAGADGAVYALRRPPRRLAVGGRAGSARRGHGCHPRRWRVLAGGVGRRGVQLRRRPVRGRASAPCTSTSPSSAIAATSDGGGYWLVASDGGVFSFGDARFYGSLGAVHLNQPVVGMAATPDGSGYWLVASDGGVFSFGDARFEGSLGATHLNAAVVGMASTGDGRGYWLTGADGGRVYLRRRRIPGQPRGVPPVRAGDRYRCAVTVS